MSGLHDSFLEAGDVSWLNDRNRSLSQLHKVLIDYEKAPICHSNILLLTIAPGAIIRY